MECFFPAITNSVFTAKTLAMWIVSRFITNDASVALDIG